MQVREKIIIGAGLYGLYSALYCARKGQNVTVLEIEPSPFSRATYINQARVHMGYHYPRSLSTAMKSAGYFKRFVQDYEFCINSKFQQIYATSTNFSWTDAKEFRKFCHDARIPCKNLNTNDFFKEGLCDGVFLTEEYTYDAKIMMNYFLEELKKYPSVELKFQRTIQRIIKGGGCYTVLALYNGKEEVYQVPYVLNATYASVNQILQKIEFSESDSATPALSFFDIKYELCEIILCRVNERLKNIGLTVMDGPFFSIMPFGKTGYHSLTSVCFTPHKVSNTLVPTFDCCSCNGGGVRRIFFGQLRRLQITPRKRLGIYECSCEKIYA